MTGTANRLSLNDALATDEFFSAYVECALWSSTDNSNEQGGDPLDDNYSADDIADETLAEMHADCQAFLATMTGADGSLALTDSIDAHDMARAGHDFWLTRNRHGAGFWDGDWAQEMVATDDDGNEIRDPQYPTLGDYLTAVAKPYGEFNLYVGDDGRIYGA